MDPEGTKKDHLLTLQQATDTYDNDIHIKLYLKVWNNELAKIAQRWADQCPGNNRAMHDSENGYVRMKLNGKSVSLF